MTYEELLASNEIYRDVYESQTGGGTADFDEGMEQGGLEEKKVRFVKEGGEGYAEK